MHWPRKTTCSGEKKGGGAGRDPDQPPPPARGSLKKAPSPRKTACRGGGVGEKPVRSVASKGQVGAAGAKRQTAEGCSQAFPPTSRTIMCYALCCKFGFYKNKRSKISAFPPNHNSGHVRDTHRHKGGKLTTEFHHQLWRKQSFRRKRHKKPSKKKCDSRASPPRTIIGAPRNLTSYIV